MVTDEQSFLIAIDKDQSVRMIYADYLDERDRHEEATEQRIMATAKKEIILAEFLEDCNWEEVFGEGSGGNCDKETDACPPGATIDLTPPKRTDVVDILAAVNGENDGDSWTGIFKLKDGRYLLAEGSCDFTGWD